VVVIGALGCQSAEERCNTARVGAHDAWDAWATQIRADFETYERAHCPPRGEISAARMDCEVAAHGSVGGPPAGSIERVRDAASGRALPFRDRVRAFRQTYAEETESPLGQAALAAADGAWDACQSVDP
jgi:hypothetical protein